MDLKQFDLLTLNIWLARRNEMIEIIVAHGANYQMQFQLKIGIIA